MLMKWEDLKEGDILEINKDHIEWTGDVIRKEYIGKELIVDRIEERKTLRFNNIPLTYFVIHFKNGPSSSVFYDHEYNSKYPELYNIIRLVD